jgi:hypothetical protein
MAACQNGVAGPKSSSAFKSTKRRLPPPVHRTDGSMARRGIRLLHFEVSDPPANCGRRASTFRRRTLPIGSCYGGTESRPRNCKPERTAFFATDCSKLEIVFGESDQPRSRPGRNTLAEGVFRSYHSKSRLILEDFRIHPQPRVLPILNPSIPPPSIPRATAGRRGHFLGGRHRAWCGQGVPPSVGTASRQVWARRLAVARATGGVPRLDNGTPPDADSPSPIPRPRSPHPRFPVPRRDAVATFWVVGIGHGVGRASRQVWARRLAVARATGGGPRLDSGTPPDADSPPSIPRATAGRRGHFSFFQGRAAITRPVRAPRWPQGERPRRQRARCGREENHGGRPPPVERVRVSRPG